MLHEHIRGLEDWLEKSIIEAKRLSSTQEDVRTKLRTWYRKCFLYLANNLKGLSFTEYISLRFDRKLAKVAISHAVNSTDGEDLRNKFHITEEEHIQLEQAEIDIIMRITQEYDTIKDRIPSRIKRTPKIEYYLCGITVDELGNKFPRDPQKRGAGAAVIKIIKEEVQLGHICGITNMSEFHRSLVVAYGPVIPKNVQQLARELV